MTTLLYTQLRQQKKGVPVIFIKLLLEIDLSIDKEDRPWTCQKIMANYVICSKKVHEICENLEVHSTGATALLPRGMWSPLS